MIDPNFIQNEITTIAMHLASMDKETLISCIYPFWLYIIMDGVTRSSSRRHARARHH